MGVALVKHLQYVGDEIMKFGVLLNRVSHPSCVRSCPQCPQDFHHEWEWTVTVCNKVRSTKTSDKTYQIGNNMFKIKT